MVKLAAASEFELEAQRLGKRVAELEAEARAAAAAEAEAKLLEQELLNQLRAAADAEAAACEARGEAEARAAELEERVEALERRHGEREAMLEEAAVSCFLLISVRVCFALPGGSRSFSFSEFCFF